jgi:choline-sulfatase
MYDPAAMPLPIPPTSDQDKTASSNVLRRRTKATGLAVSDIQQMRANYAGKVSLIDDQVGQIVETVQHRRELDRTIIIFTSDHGEMNGDHGLIYKSNFYRSAVSVPLLIRLPGPMGDAVAGKTCSNLAESFDIGPTLVDLVGGKLAFQQFGKSLVPYLRSGADKGRSVAISEYLGEIMIMDHVWKAAINPDGTVYQLFQVRDDPDELTNLAGRPEVAEVETELRLRAFRQVLQTQMDLGRKI